MRSSAPSQIPGRYHLIDSLIVLHGTRYVELYSPAHGFVEHFTVKPDLILHGRKVLVKGGAILGWPVGVFHRIISCDKEGSASLNLAVHKPGSDSRTNFNIDGAGGAPSRFLSLLTPNVSQRSM